MVIKPEIEKQLEAIIPLIGTLPEGEELKIPITSYTRLFMHKIVKHKLTLLFLAGKTNVGNLTVTVPRPKLNKEYTLVIKYTSHKKEFKKGLILGDIRILDLFRSGFSPSVILSSMEDRLSSGDKEIIENLIDSPLMTRKK